MLPKAKPYCEAPENPRDITMHREKSFPKNRFAEETDSS